MDDVTKQFLLTHWKLILEIWLASNLISAMPKPNSFPGTYNVFYAMAYGTLHGIMGNGARIVMAFFPGLSKFLTPGSNGSNGNGNGDSTNNNSKGGGTSVQDKNSSESGSGNSTVNVNGSVPKP